MMKTKNDDITLNVRTIQQFSGTHTPDANCIPSGTTHTVSFLIKSREFAEQMENMLFLCVYIHKF